jgi:Flp pilus assembly protein TadG
MRAFNWLRRLRRDERGTSVVELALILPFLTALTVGVIDLSNGISMRFNLHQSVHRTLELAASRTLTLDQETQEYDFDFLIEEAAAAANVEPEAVTLSKWLECDGVEQDETEFYGQCPIGETSARYIQVRIDKVYTPTFPIGVVGGGGDIPLFAEAAVRIQ